MLSCVAAMVFAATSSVPLEAQRIAPSGVHRLDAAHAGLTSADTSTVQARSHIDGAVHGGLIGLGAGALTGVTVYVAAHAFVSSHDPQVVTSNDKVVLFWWSTGLGALAGAALGATIGGIVGR